MTNMGLPINQMAKKIAMTDISKASANQSTFADGTLSDWIVELDGEELYRLPAHISVEDTFLIRRIAEKMMSIAYDDGVKYAETVASARLHVITENGDAKLDFLKQENERLSEIINQIHGEAD